jgi:hypothetical protein
MITLHMIVNAMAANEPVQATAAALCGLSGLEDSLFLGFVLAHSPAAVPDLLR